MLVFLLVVYSEEYYRESVCVCVCLIVCDLASSTVRRPRPDMGSWVTEEEAWTRFICLRIGIIDWPF